MRNIIITGGGRKVGKTTLALALAQLLPDSVVVKLGVHPAKPSKRVRVFGRKTPYRELLCHLRDQRYAIIESGSLLDDPDFSADLIIFLPRSDGQPDKPEAAQRRRLASLVRGEPVTDAQLDALGRQLALDRATCERFVALVQQTPQAPEGNGMPA